MLVGIGGGGGVLSVVLRKRIKEFYGNGMAGI